MSAELVHYEEKARQLVQVISDMPEPARTQMEEYLSNLFTRHRQHVTQLLEIIEQRTNALDELDCQNRSLRAQIARRN